MIKLAFYGAVRTVTGSKHLLILDDLKILLDCGLFQGHRKDTYDRNLNFEFDPESLSSIIISHAHIDHVGNLPNLVKQGYRKDIYATSATIDLAAVMLTDSANIQESDIKFVNKIRIKHHESELQPLYTVEDIPPVLKLFRGSAYDHSFKIDENIIVNFRDAGHILGSAISILKINDQGRSISICYTGDLGRYNMPIIRDPASVTDCDILIVESTYGDRLHSDVNNVKDKLASVINETVSKGGKLIVPSFALERTQELVYYLHQLKLEHKISDIPVFVDSPLAIDATDIFRIHPECYDKEIADFLLTNKDPFGFSGLHFISSVEESKSLNNIDTPMMIIAGSGMAESGRILHHLKNNIGNPKNTILIVGWQAENTLGRKIKEKWPEVSIFGEKYKLRSRVEVFDEFSAHADRNDLIRWCLEGKSRWQKIFIVHGEEAASLALAEALNNAGLKNVIVPQYAQEYII